jgi:hypothetical protein
LINIEKGAMVLIIADRLRGKLFIGMLWMVDWHDGQSFLWSVSSLACTWC